MSGVQLIFEFPDVRAERRFIGIRCALDRHRNGFTIYSYQLHFTINIGECTFDIQFFLD